MEIRTGKCPHCERTLSSVNMQTIDISVNLQPTYKGASLSCPFCQKILQVGLDPFIYREKIVEKVAEKLGK